MLTATLAASLLFSSPAAQTPSGDTTSLAALERRIERIAAESGATVGVTAIHVESGERVSVRGGERFPMQSVFKLPIALQLLRRVDAGAVRLDNEVVVLPAHHRYGHSPLAEASRGDTVRLTVRELLRRMAGESDNTASDRLLELAGGAAAVTANLRRHGVDGVRLDRSEGRLALEANGVPYAPEREPLAVAERLIGQVAPDARRAATERYLIDPRDTSTPDGMARLLVLLHRGRLLRPASSALLTRILEETQTGPNRLKGMLPAGTVVAHKTGTSMVVDGMTATVNDVGLITLPDGAGHVAIAVFAKRSTRGTEAAERAIAQIARAAYDHWSARGRGRGSR